MLLCGCGDNETSSKKSKKTKKEETSSVSGESSVKSTDENESSKVDEEKQLISAIISELDIKSEKDISEYKQMLYANPDDSRNEIQNAASECNSDILTFSQSLQEQYEPLMLSVEGHPLSYVEITIKLQSSQEDFKRFLEYITNESTGLFNYDKAYTMTKADTDESSLYNTEITIVQYYFDQRVVIEDIE